MAEYEIEVTTQDGIADGYMVLPAESGCWPGIVYYSDIFGILEAPLDMARRLAGHGYAVLVPNIFYRTGKAPFFKERPAFGDPATRSRMGELSGPLTSKAMEADAAAYVDWLAGRCEVIDGRVGVVGYCFSGAMALRTAAVRPDRVKAAASFHGARLYTGEPTSPHRVLPRVRARLYFAHADQDQSMPAEAIAKFAQALADWGGRYESEIYAGARHGWTVPDSPVYDRASAERAWAKLTGMLEASLFSGG